MVNFRFHLVSLTAVFLALAAGIAIGAGVVEGKTVDLLNRRLDAVESNRAKTNSENDVLKAENDQWDRFGEQAGDRIVVGQLPGTRVLVVGVEGTERGPVDRVSASVVAAGADSQGSLWFTPKWQLTKPEDTRQLADLLGRSPTTRPADLRAEALERLADTWAAGLPGEMLLPMREASFVEYDAPAGREMTLEDVTVAGTLFLFAADDAADVPNADLGVPAVAAFANEGVPLVAVQPRPADDRPADAPPPFVTALRGEDDVAAKVSTVDNVDEYPGRVAAVLALAELVQGRTGHYGAGSGAERLIPEQPA